MRIRVLDDRLIDQIAAGEVVERPASVVKELVENAIDARATRIRVTLRAGGRTLIRVVDDGMGMSRDDAVLCIERHATSKIRTADDLARVMSLGFRGEALPSIASVSRFALTTRPADEDVGTRVVVDGGALGGVEDAGCAPGTEIDVRSLFFNLPVRRTFLRTTGTELGHCVEAVARQAMIRPDVAFELHHEERQIIRVDASDSARRIGELLGANGGALVPVAFREGGLSVRGFASPVGVHRSTRTGSQYLYVNGRYVRDAVVQRAMTEAYRSIVPKGRYPLAVLEISVDPTQVDVNVHPAKIEVRFRSPRDVTRILADGLRRALEEHGIRRQPFGGLPLPSGGSGAEPIGPRPPSIPAHPGDDPRFAGAPRMPTVDPLPSGTARPSATAAESISAVPGRASSSGNDGADGGAVAADPRPPWPHGSTSDVPRYRDLRVIGQLGGAFVLCESPAGLVVVDQRAANERLVRHRLRRARHGAAAIARLEQPVEVQVPGPLGVALCERLPLLVEAHLDVAHVEGDRFAVRGVAAPLLSANMGELLRAVAAQVAMIEVVTEPVIEDLMATVARHAPVPGDLSVYDMRALLAALDEVDVPVRASDRPVAVHVSTTELEHRFRDP